MHELIFLTILMHLNPGSGLPSVAGLQFITAPEQPDLYEPVSRANRLKPVSPQLSIAEVEDLGGVTEYKPNGD